MDRSEGAAVDDYYVLLGVSPVATFDEIKEAYRKQALRFHPDKNRDTNATDHFQRLGRAWEVLRDAERRRYYDLDSARLRIDDLNRVKWRQWEAAQMRACSAEQVARVEKAREWRQVLRKEYLTRLHAWKEFRQRQLVAIKHYDILVRRYEQQLETQIKESEETMIQRFTAAISLSESKGQQLGDHAEVVSRLMEARRVYVLNLKLAGQASKGRLQHLVAELKSGRNSYEEKEFSIRQYYVRQALEVLESRDFNTPIFSVIDRRRQSINYWKSLGRVKKASGPFSLLEMSESPWHEGGEWMRIPGDHSCARCAKSAFHLIPGCGAARCPRCGTIVCNSCHRELELLRDFEAWIVADGDLRNSLFSLEFEDGSGPIESWDEEGIGRCWA